LKVARDERISRPGLVAFRVQAPSNGFPRQRVKSLERAPTHVIVAIGARGKRKPSKSSVKRVALVEAVMRGDRVLGLRRLESR
jgi:hypothetical protein